MFIFKIISCVLLISEILGTFVAFCNESDDCQLSDVIVLSIILTYVILS